MNQSEKQTYICVDLETTGLHSNEHGICQIGAVALDPSGRIVFSSDVNPLPCNISEQALAVNGFSLERIKAGKSLDGALIEFCSFILTFPNPVLIIHNAPFDTDFLKAAFRRLSSVALECLQAWYMTRGDFPGSIKYDGTMPGMRRVIDTVGMGFGLLPDLEKTPSLATLVARLELDASTWNAHDALGDAQMLATVFERLMDLRRRNAAVREALAATFLDHLEAKSSLGKAYDHNSYAAGYEHAACDLLNILENPCEA